MFLTKMDLYIVRIRHSNLVQKVQLIRKHCLPPNSAFVSFWTAGTGVGKQLRRYLGLQAKPEDLETLGKKIKQYCGTGGSVKDGQILIQGDQTAKVRTYLQKEGYKGVRHCLTR